MSIAIQNLLAAFFFPLPSGERIKVRRIKKERDLSATLTLALSLAGRGKRHAPRAGNLSLSLLILFTFSCSLFAQITLAATATTPEQYEQQGWSAFQRGAFADAVSSWQSAVRLYEQQGETKRQAEARLYLSQAYQAVGHPQEALNELHSALALANVLADPLLLTSILGNIGNVYAAMGQEEKAAQYLDDGIRQAKAQDDAQLTATIQNDKGNLLWAQGKFAGAIVAYEESHTFADKAGNNALVARALTNAAKAQLKNQQPQKSYALLEQALEKTRSLEDSHDKAYGLIAIGLGYRDLRAQLPHDSAVLLQLSGKMFTEAGNVAEAIHDSRAASYAWGYLGQLYEEERRYQEALELTRRAIAAVQSVHAPEALYLWQWQIGRLLKAQGASGDAMTAYRLALSTLETVRPELTHGGKVRRASTRETVKGVYLGLVDLVLQHAASAADAARVETDLREARTLMEAFKVAELQEYFRDDCVELLRASTKSLDEVSRTAVVVYPIVLPDRLELLVSVPTTTKVELQRFAVPVTELQLAREVNEFRGKLEKRSTYEYRPHGQQLYEWLIRPFESQLTLRNVSTIVFVPDGLLRTIPIAALHDGKQFLIEKYALATTPGLSLTDPQPLQRGQGKVLAVGLTEAAQGFPALPGVSAELQALQDLYQVNLLVNQDFVLSKLERELRDEQLSIVHIASHGQFAGEVEKSFLLTFDDRLTMERLDQLIGLFKFRETPLEMLTLSACETAAGDDQATLGLAGIAIKAGARSALATLWHVNDPAASLLTTEFYRQLQDPAASRASALRRAQLHVLENPRYQHPGYWAPFLLINNWL